MELEHRVKQLERDMDILKGEIEQTLLDVRENLLERPTSPSRKRKRAWTLALLNVLLGLTLFTNLCFYTSDAPSSIHPVLIPWLRAFWIVLAFLWLILQMYPLTLLLDQEETHAPKVAWRNAIRIFTSNPGLTLMLMLAVLGVAVISMAFPLLWFVVVGVILAVVGVNGILYVLRSHRQRANVEDRE
jgi:hypothetical protein